MTTSTTSTSTATSTYDIQQLLAQRASLDERFASELDGFVQTIAQTIFDETMSKIAARLSNPFIEESGLVTAVIRFSAGCLPAIFEKCVTDPSSCFGQLLAASKSGGAERIINDKLKIVCGATARQLQKLFAENVKTPPEDSKIKFEFDVEWHSCGAQTCPLERILKVTAKIFDKEKPVEDTNENRTEDEVSDLLAVLKNAFGPDVKVSMRRFGGI